MIEDINNTLRHDTMEDYYAAWLITPNHFDSTASLYFDYRFSMSCVADTSHI